jgi:hypothetical protein
MFRVLFQSSGAFGPFIQGSRVFLGLSQGSGTFGLLFQSSRVFRPLFQGSVVLLGLFRGSGMFLGLFWGSGTFRPSFQGSGMCLGLFQGSGTFTMPNLNLLSPTTNKENALITFHCLIPTHFFYLWPLGDFCVFHS